MMNICTLLNIFFTFMFFIIFLNWNYKIPVEMTENIKYVEMDDWLENQSGYSYTIKSDFIQKRETINNRYKFYLKEKEKDENDNVKIIYYNINYSDSFNYIYIYGLYYEDTYYNLQSDFLHANIITTNSNTTIDITGGVFLKTDKTANGYKVKIYNYNTYTANNDEYYIYSEDFDDITVINKDVNGVSDTETASKYIIEGNEDYSIKFNTFKIDETEQSYDSNKSVYTIKGFQCEFKNSVTIPDGKTIENTENSKDVIFDKDLTLGEGSKFIAEHAHVIIKGSLTLGENAEIKCRKLTV